jgi:hypothetical protein
MSTSETSSLHATLILQLSDIAGVPVSVLRRAENEVTRMYAAIGVHVEWSDGTADRTPESSSASQPLSLRVTLLPNETGDLRHAPRVVMGAAVRASTGTQTAWAFYGRVQQQSDRYGLDHGLVLGHTVAHEIGHLLLPAGGHSSTGLMQKCWSREELSRATRGQLHFTAEQADQIRAAVAR